MFNSNLVEYELSMRLHIISLSSYYENDINPIENTYSASLSLNYISHLSSINCYSDYYVLFTEISNFNELDFL